MDWARAITINQAALSRIVATLVAMVGLQAESALSRLPRPLYRQVMRILRAAEAAVRRLIIIAARGVTAEQAPVRSRPEGRKPGASPRGRGSLQFQLFDTRKRFDLRRRKYVPDHLAPRVWTVGDNMPAHPWGFRPAAPEDDGTVDAARLGRRLAAIKAALDDLPAQTKRLVRWRARRQAMASPKFRDPLRPGRPPGYRKKPRDEIDFVLKECHALASEVLREDSS
jgi:hypothetical protein